MKSRIDGSINSLIGVARTVLLAAVVTFVALVAVELWTFNDPGSMIELRSGVIPKGEDSAVFFRLQNTAKRTVNFTFTLKVYAGTEVRENSWSVSICPGSDFEYLLHTDAVGGLRKVNVRIHREREDDPIRDIMYFLLDDESTEL